MPLLLPRSALEAPSSKARWAVAIAAAAALTAWHPAWTGAYDTVRGAIVPTTGEVYTWDGGDLRAAPAADAAGLLEGIDDPARAQARTLTIPAEAITIDLVWEAPLEVGEVRLETYTDAFGTGRRLGIAAEATTADGTNCVGARLSSPAGTTLLQTCTRVDRHAPVDMAAFLGKESDDDWSPDKLFITQTANLDPVDHATATQVDYYGLGVHLGDPNESGLWGPQWSEPMWTGNYHPCDDLDRLLVLEDLHLSDRYADPSAHQRGAEATVYRPARTEPAEGRLRTPACIDIRDLHDIDIQTAHAFAADPFQQSSPTPLAGWARYNAVTTGPQPMRTAAVIDIRSCDADLEHCTTDPVPGPYSANRGDGRTWMSELLGS